MADIPDVKLDQVVATRDEATFSVVVDGNELGKVTFVRYYGPRLEVLDPYVALWAGPTLCVIDRQHGTMRCIDRDDVTHHVIAFESAWIVEGELRVDLFDPRSGTMAATYSHSDVITSCSVADGLVHVRGDDGTTVTLDPHRSLQLVRRAGAVTSKPLHK